MLRRLVSCTLGALLTACTASQTGPESTTSAILPEDVQAQLQPGESDLAPDLLYVAPGIDGRGYDKVMIDPIIYFAPPQAPRRISADDRQTLVNNFHILMGREIGKDFLLAIEPQRGTVRVQFALLAETAQPVAMDTVAMVAREDPNTQVVIDSLASPIAPGADLIIESLWTDAVTGQVVGATVDRHFGQGSFDGASFTSWAEVNRYLEAYAVLVRYRICSFRGGTGCTPPAVPPS